MISPVILIVSAFSVSVPAALTLFSSSIFISLSGVVLTVFTLTVTGGVLSDCEAIPRRFPHRNRL